MHFHFSFYSSVLLIFFSQGIVFSFLLLKKGWLQNDTSNFWLSLFVFLCSLYIVPWMVGFAGWYSLQPYQDILFYIPFQQLLLIGPVIFFYTQCLLNPSFLFSKRDTWHLVPAFLYNIYRLIIFLVDKVFLHEYYFYANGRDKSLDTWYQLAGLLSMLFYFFLSLRYYHLYRKFIFQVVSFADSMLFKWISRFLIAFFFMQVFCISFLLLYPDWGSFKEKWWYYFIFSFLFYYIAITAYANNIRNRYAFQGSITREAPLYLLYRTPDQLQYVALYNNRLPAIGQIKTDAGSNEAEENTTVKSDLERLLMVEEIYKDPELTLSGLSKKVNSNPSVVSRVINQGFQMNFNDFINKYRVEAVVRMLQKGVYKNQTLLAIAFDCGFNSKSTFNRAFKKSISCSPKEYILQLEKEST